MKLLDDLQAFLWLDPSANNCNTYLIPGERNILIDPGHYAFLSHVSVGLERLSLSLADIHFLLITHGHPDHIEGVIAFSSQDTLIALHRTEMAFIRKVAPHYGSALGLPVFEPQILLQEGDLAVGGRKFQVIHTPGHSPGSICLYWPERKALFTGDVVFSHGLGRTDLPGGSGPTLKESIRRISALEVEYLLPGHGDVVIGADRVRENFLEIERVWFDYL
jgi:glyoxylase-like metal-dependent hydrolase (beta-lactamase superfamily II)